MLLFILSVLLCFVFSILLYLRYAKKNIHYFTTICILISWNIVFMLSILIPYSLYLAYIPLENKLSNIIRTILYCFYVIIQILSICIFPILIEYEVAGEFTFKERLIASFKKNIIFYSICLMLGVLVFTYLLIKQQISL